MTNNNKTINQATKKPKKKKHDPNATYCIHCGAKIRKIENSKPYIFKICHHCISTLPEYAELRRSFSRERQQKYYQKNRYQEIKRAALNREKAKQKT